MNRLSLMLAVTEWKTCFKEIYFTIVILPKKLAKLIRCLLPNKENYMRCIYPVDVLAIAKAKLVLALLICPIKGFIGELCKC